MGFRQTHHPHTHPPNQSASPLKPASHQQNVAQENLMASGCQSSIYRGHMGFRRGVPPPPRAGPPQDGGGSGPPTCQVGSASNLLGPPKTPHVVMINLPTCEFKTMTLRGLAWDIVRVLPGTQPADQSVPEVLRVLGPTCLSISNFPGGGDALQPELAGADSRPDYDISDQSAGSHVASPDVLHPTDKTSAPLPPATTCNPP